MCRALVTLYVASIVMAGIAAWVWYDELSRRLITEGEEWHGALRRQRDEAEQERRDVAVRGYSARNGRANR